MNGFQFTTLVIGGARSGKSLFAEGLVTATGAPVHYIATAQAFDDEMRERITMHQSRRGQGWITHEAPIDLAGAIAAVGDGPVLVDCLTLWLTNLMLSDHDTEGATAAVLHALSNRPALTVLVSNEVGLGIVPDNALARRFRDEAGRLNQRIARDATHVVFMAAGLPMTMKDTRHG
jgi:adenosylcobinamide kinase / adenosylcobinamide-phosphate guanylyltransferase